MTGSLPTSPHLRSTVFASDVRSASDFPAHDDALAALRAATREHHERIDRLMNVARMQDRRRYARILQAFDAFLAGWEPAVAAVLPPSWQGWLQRRSRRAFLQRDLAVLGIAAHAPARVHAPAGPAAAWGSLYVMEGSALGGQVITRTLARAGLRPDHGAAYFHGWGADTGAMWRDFRTTLARELATPDAIAQACEAARQTFDTLTHLLEHALHERTTAA